MLLTFVGSVSGALDGANDGAVSPSISDDEQYQKLDGASLWQQGQAAAAAKDIPAGTVPAADAEPEVQQASMDDREVRLAQQDRGHQSLAMLHSA